LVQGLSPILGESDVPLVVALLAGTILLYGASFFRDHGYFFRETLHSQWLWPQIR